LTDVLQAQFSSACKHYPFSNPNVFLTQDSSQLQIYGGPGMDEID